MAEETNKKTVTEAPETEETILEELPKEDSEKSILEKISDKKEEAKMLDQESQDLAEENNLPSENDSDVISKGEKFLSAIGYLSFLCILPLVLKPKSEFCQLHGKQGLILILLWLISTPIRFFGNIMFSTNFFTGFFGSIYIVLICYGIFIVIKEKKEMPILGKIAKKLNW